MNLGDFPVCTGVSLVPQMVKKLPAMLETWVQPLDWEDLLEKGIGNPLQSCCLENPMDSEDWWALVHEVIKIGHN